MWCVKVDKRAKRKIVNNATSVVLSEFKMYYFIEHSSLRVRRGRGLETSSRHSASPRRGDEVDHWGNFVSR